MPLTGIQALSARVLPPDTDVIDDPWTLNQIIGLINGNFGMPVKLVALNSQTEWALKIQPLNNFAGFGRALTIVDEAGNEKFSVWTHAGLVANVPAQFTQAVTMAPSLVVLTAGGATLLDLTNALVKIATGITSDVRFGETTGNVLIGGVNSDNTDIFMGGTGSYIALTAANIDISTSGYFKVNGANVPWGKTGTYTGNGAVTQRQIVTGFQVKSLILERVSTGSQWFSQNTSNSTFVGTGPTIQQQSSVHLHASDGFWVADGAVNGNNGGETFNYTAFR